VLTATVPRRTTRSAPLLKLEVLVALVALAPRIGFVLISEGGYRGTFAYDPSVYYAASDALLHGRLPYRDFVLLHPPGIMFALAPFAWVGTMIGDHGGFMIAQVAFTVLAAVNAALVARVAARFGFGNGAAMVAGLCYALWPGATEAEYASRLEPLGNFAMLCGLLAYSASERSTRRRWSVLCGIGFSTAFCVKVWWLIPLVLVLAWHLPAQRRARLPLVAAGAALPILLIDGPFFLASPVAMIRMVFTDQLGRSRQGRLLPRLAEFSGGGDRLRGLGDMQAAWVVLAVALVLVLICRAAVRVPHGPPLVALLLIQLALIAWAPSYFPYYNDYAAPALALTLAAAVHGRRVRPVVRRVFAIPVLMLGIGALVAADLALPRPVIFAYPARELMRSVAHSRCVMSDSPMALVELNVLSRDLANGCPNWVDVTGRTYSVDKPFRDGSGHWVARTYDPRWQRDLRRYLLSGDTLTLFRPYYTGVGAELRFILAGQVVLARSGNFTVFRTSPLRPWHRPPTRLAPRGAR
jgi:hypothetical protein